MRWNGTQHWLGFAPRVNQGQFEVYALDLDKNLLPLLVGPPRPSVSRRVAVIDPGHGGEDTGAQSIVSEDCERDYALDWGRRLQALLAARGWTVFLTRTDDRDQSLSNRVAIAQAKQADLFLSLHFNSAPLNASRAGVETYCLTPAGLPSTLLRDAAEDSTVVYPNNAFDAQNLALAASLHHELVTATAGVDGGVRRARFMGVLRGQKRPAVLIEGGYLSNRREAELIAKPSYRQKLAEAVARAVANYAESQGEGQVSANPPSHLTGASAGSGR
jgi:N-acetylmuramoyl-L-alanine amidase